MKITAGKREDILRRKAEYQAKLEEYEKDRDERGRRHREADYAIIEPVKKKIEQDLSHFDLLKFQIDLSKGYNWEYEKNGGDEHYIEVRIRCNDWSRDDNDALRWNFDVKLDRDGKVLKETGSWSGLQATTVEQLNSLKQTVEAIELLNSYDWEHIIKAKFPDFKQFYEGSLDRPEKPDTFNELTQATMEELIGADSLVKINGWGEEFTARYYWAHVVGQTEKQWRLQIIPNYVIEAIKRDSFDDPEDKQRYIDSVKRTVTDDWTVRARKSSIRLSDVDNPEIVTFEELGI